jgi:Response regulator containing a CheY-like receiver domain and an HTH DNA-binding domain
MTKTPITISLVEDHPGVRKSLAALLNSVPGFRCLEPFGTGDEALKKMPSQRPDVALVDINLPGMSGIECVAKLKRDLPELQILMLTMCEQTDLIFNSLRAGASGYLLKSAPAAELIQAIEQVHTGGAPMTMQIARKIVQHFQQTKRQGLGEKLTPRELEVLELVVQGCLNKEAAERLNISLSAVRAHLHAVYGKLRVQSRTQALVKFLGYELPRRGNSAPYGGPK